MQERRTQEVDYLDESLLTADMADSEGYQFTAREVKYAALCLMLNPNSISSRWILTDYAYRHIFSGGNEARCAAVSLALGRVARGIHTYDRHKYPLIGFLQLCYDRAYRDLFAGKENRDSQAPMAGGGRAAWEDARGGGSKRSGDIDLEKKIGELMANPQGPPVPFPLKQAAGEGGREAVPYFLYSMSPEELDEALRRLRSEKRPAGTAMTGFPLLRRPSELAAEMDAFAEWYRPRAKPKNRERNLYLFRRYRLDGCNIAALLADEQARSFPGKLTDATVRYAVYDKMQPAFAAFRLENSEGQAALDDPNG